MIRLNFLMLFLLALLLASCGQPTNNQTLTPNFSLEPALSTLEVTQGGESSLWIALSRSGGFDKTVKMQLSGLPEGISQSWSRDTENGDCTLILRVDENVPPGTYSFEVRGEIEGNGLNLQGFSSAATSFTLTVTPLVPTFFVSLQPSILSVPKDSVTGLQVSITRLFFFNSAVSLSLLAAPDGVSASFTPNSAGSEMALSVAPQTTNGTYNLTLQATGGGQTKNVPLRLTVTGSGSATDPDFKLLLSALNVSVKQGDNAPLRVFLMRIRGFSGPVTVRLFNPPVPVFAENLRIDALSGLLTLRVTEATPITPAPVSVTVQGSASISRPPTDGPQTQPRATVREAQVNLRVTPPPPPPGSFDEAFGTPCALINCVPATAFVIQPDNKIVVGGVLGSRPKRDIVIGRLKADGSLDTSFGNSGSVVIDFFSESDDNLADLALAKDGSIVVLGTAIFGDDNLALARLTPNGQRDPTFGNGATMLISSGSERVDNQVAVQKDGKIIILDVRADSAVLFRVLSNGSGLDSSFADAGSRFIGQAVKALTVQNDDRILVVGSGFPGNSLEQDALIRRFTKDGQVDDAFQGGSVFTGFGAKDEFSEVAVDAQGRVVAVGFRNNDFTLVEPGIMTRLKNDGDDDTSFAGNGRLAVTDRFLDLGTTNTRILGLAIHRDGKPLLVVETNNARPGDSDIGRVLIRLTADGKLDTSFSDNGKVALEPLGLLAAREIAVDASGRIVVLRVNKIGRFFP